MVAVKPLTVHWHQDSAPIYSACFQPQEAGPLPPNRTPRLATAGGDNNVRIWRLRVGASLDETPGVEYLATLAKHERAVNCVAFDASGRVLASAGDDGVVCLWALSEAAAVPAPAFGAEFEELESWRLVRKCRSASFGEIYDLAWSPSGRFVAATSMDKIVSILDTADGTCVAALRDHKHYVQGVSWDPQGQYLATQSSDQRVIVYALREDAAGKLAVEAPVARLEKAELPGRRQSSFHPESFSSFFRRLAFSPDGALLLAPAAQIDQAVGPAADRAGPPEPLAPPPGPAAVDAAATTAPSPSVPSAQSAPSAPSSAALAAHAAPAPEDELRPKPRPEPTQNCALIYARGDLRRPAGVVPLPKQSTVVRFCPLRFQRRSGAAQSGLPEYRMVYAIATLNGVFIYDTESAAPLGMASNLHYSSLTDLAWSPDGRMLLLTSIDGFCSVVRFERGELGEVYTPAGGAPVPAPAPASAPALHGASASASAAEPAVNTLAVRRKPRPAAAPTSTAAPASSSSAAPAPASAGAPSESSAAAV